MTTTENTVQGKYGFYTCDYETYQKLRKLYGFYIKSRTMDKAHDRWARKEPQNRVLKQVLRDDKNRRIGYRVVLDESGKPIYRPEPPLFNVPINHLVESDYRNARKPKATPEEVKPLQMTLSSIDQQLAACERETQK